MTRSRFLALGGISLLVGAVVTLYLYRYMDAKSGSTTMVDAIVAAKDLTVGAPLQRSDVKTVRVPVSILPPDSRRNLEEVVGRGVIVPIAEGQFIVSMQLAGENAGSGLSSLIPPGMRAVGVPVNDVTSVAGFVMPGTRVDVLMTPNGEHRAITVLQNIAVLATGATLEHNGVAGQPRNFSVATLLVRLDDAQRLILATKEGRVQLVLRNPVDTRADKVKDATLLQLYEGAPAIERVRTTKARLNPAVLPRSDTPEIQIYQGPEIHTFECKDGGSCSPETKTH
jgi:pilus assembly protein CpaB